MQPIFKVTRARRIDSHQRGRAQAGVKKLRASVAVLLVLTVMVSACQSGPSEYERRAALVAMATAQSIDATRQSIADGTETSKQIAIKAIANRLTAVDIFAATDEPSEYAGTKALLMADDVGVQLSTESTDNSLDTQESAFDKWKAIMIKYDMALVIED